MCRVCSVLALFGLAPLASCTESNHRFLQDLDVWCRINTTVEADPAIKPADKAHEIGRRFRATNPSPEFQTFSYKLIGKSEAQAYQMIKDEAARRGRKGWECPALKK
jgi:hypothetical protein